MIYGSVAISGCVIGTSERTEQPRNQEKKFMTVSMRVLHPRSAQMSSRIQHQLWISNVTVQHSPCLQRCL